MFLATRAHCEKNHLWIEPGSNEKARDINRRPSVSMDSHRAILPYGNCRHTCIPGRAESRRKQPKPPPGTTPPPHTLRKENANIQFANFTIPKPPPVVLRWSVNSCGDLRQALRHIDRPRLHSQDPASIFWFASIVPAVPQVHRLLLDLGLSDPSCHLRSSVPLRFGNLH